MAFCYGKVNEKWAESLKKFPLLEELGLYVTYISHKVIVAAGCFCPMLTTLKINYDLVWHCGDGIATAIGENLPQLKHLQLIGHIMLNNRLQAILDGCPKLELLDLRQCLCINLNGEFVKKSLEKIKCVKLPHESLQGCL